MKTYIIAGGGTGGHIYPALAIAEALKKAGGDIHFVGTAKGLETTLVPRAGYPLHLLPVSGMKNLGVLQKLFALIQLPISFARAVLILLRLKPDAVLGVGGYASGPMVLAAALLGRRSAVFEPNAYPGMTNRWLSRFVNRCFVTSDAAMEYFSKDKTVASGMPLRKGIEPRAREEHGELRILVTGGSQGARAINEAISTAVEQGCASNAPWLNGISLIHQTGPADFEKVRARYAKAPRGFEVHAFLHDMPERMAWADLVIGRSGAGTVAELAAAGKAAVLVPFPFAADNHQQKNAEALERSGACIMILQSDFTVERLISFIEDFKIHKEKISALEKKIAAFHKPDSAGMIAKYMTGTP